MMHITIIGTGYVGLVSGACFAEMGHTVACADINERIIASLQKNQLPIFEPGLQEIVERNQKENRLKFTHDMGSAISVADILFLCVGTPTKPGGTTDLEPIFQIVESCSKHVTREIILVIKSTVPVGTTHRIQNRIKELREQGILRADIHVVSNPEFLKEGDALRDFMKPDRIIIGTESSRAREVMLHLYEPLMKNDHPILLMDPVSSELTKYASNAFLATKISFINSIANLSEKVGANIDFVRKGIGSDSRIGASYIYPGVGYGGSCFPKDVQALISTFESHQLPAELFKEVEKANQRQKNALFEKTHKHFHGQLKGLRMAMWGLSFKPMTDDLREAPSVILIQKLTSQGVQVVAYDPVSTSKARELFKENLLVTFTEDMYEALRGADALSLMTEWRLFRDPNWGLVKSLMKSHIVFDGRNQYDPAWMKQEGFKYYSIGRS